MRHLLTLPGGEISKDFPGALEAACVVSNSKKVDRRKVEVIPLSNFGWSSLLNSIGLSLFSSQKKEGHGVAHCNSFLEQLAGFALSHFLQRNRHLKRCVFFSPTNCDLRYLLKKNTRNYRNSISTRVKPKTLILGIEAEFDYLLLDWPDTCVRCKVHFDRARCLAVIRIRWKIGHCVCQDLLVMFFFFEGTIKTLKHPKSPI